MNFKEDLLVKNIYNEIAEHFNETRSYQWKWIVDFMKKYSGKDRIYDIGCGSGRNIIPYFENFPNCIGVDSCTKFVEICNNKGLNVMESDMTKLPFEDDSADGIICIASFHHLSTNDRRIKALQELKRILKPNCQLLLSVWSVNQPEKTRRRFRYGDVIVPWNSNGIIYERYYYIFKMEEIKKLFEIVGLHIVEYKWDCGNEIFILSY